MVARRRFELVGLAATCALIAGCADRDAERAVQSALGDSDARVQRLADHGGYVCGEVERGGRARKGAYVRFVFDERGGSASVDPGFAGERPATRSADAVCLKPEAYQSVAERMSCAAAPALEDRSGRQQAFEQLWREACVGTARS